MRISAVEYARASQILHDCGGRKYDDHTVLIESYPMGYDAATRIRDLVAALGGVCGSFYMHRGPTGEWLICASVEG